VEEMIVYPAVEGEKLSYAQFKYWVAEGMFLLQILELARGLNLDLQPIWMSRADPRLQRADALSKHINSDDRSVHWDALESLRQMVGEFTVNLFASG
jgi:hypothetical protein